MPPSLDQICREIGILGPPLVIWSGDTIEGYDDTPAEASAEYDVFLKSARRTGATFYNAPGNHEFGKDPRLVPVYERRMGRLYGSFDYGNSHFIALNTCPQDAHGALLEGTLGEEQTRWLEADLAASSGARNRFVFLHHYLFGPQGDEGKGDSGFLALAERDRLHDLFRKHRVRAVFQGHHHGYWHGVRDGIDYYVSGGAGAPLDASPEEGGFLHYVLMHIQGDQLKAEVLQPWHLSVDPGPRPRVGGRVLATNTNNFALDAEHILVPLRGGDVRSDWRVTASVTYKGSTKPAAARVVRTSRDEAIVRATLAPHRTTEISVKAD